MQWTCVLQYFNSNSYNASSRTAYPLPPTLLSTQINGENCSITSIVALHCIATKTSDFHTILVQFSCTCWNTCAFGRKFLCCLLLALLVACVACCLLLAACSATISRMQKHPNSDQNLKQPNYAWLILMKPTTAWCIIFRILKTNFNSVTS